MDRRINHLRADMNAQFAEDKHAEAVSNQRQWNHRQAHRGGVLSGVRILPAVASGLRSATPVPFGNLGRTRAMTCVIVGASSGLGRALADELRSEERRVGHA